MTYHLWIPLRRPEDTGIRARAAQILEMLLHYELIERARLEGEEGFCVLDRGARYLTAEQVCEEYGERIGRMVQIVMDRSARTTTEVSVALPVEPAPYIEDPGDRYTEYRRFWREGV